jgi:hypothetical protein
VNAEPVGGPDRRDHGQIRAELAKQPGDQEVMRKLSYALAASLLALGLAGQAQAVQLGFVGGLSVQLATLDPVVLPGSGSATVNGSNGPGHLASLGLPEGVFAITAFVLPVTDPGVFPIAGVKITGMNGVADFAGDGGSGNFGGTMPILGTTKVCLYGACGSSANISNLTVPLSVVGGPGGQTTVKGAVNLTVIGAPWTTGTAAIGTITIMGGVAPASNTAAASGVVTLVTPIFISTNIGAFSVVPAFGIVNLHFVPEPGTLILLGSGIAGLVAIGRNRARK